MRWLEVLAFGLYALDATGSPLAVALTSFARFLPLLLLGAPAGALAERMEPGRLLVAAYLALAAAEALAGGAALLGGLRLWQVLLLAFVAGVFWCVEIPVRRTCHGRGRRGGACHAHHGPRDADHAPDAAPGPGARRRADRGDRARGRVRARRAPLPLGGAPDRPRPPRAGGRGRPAEPGGGAGRRGPGGPARPAADGADRHHAGLQPVRPALSRPPSGLRCPPAGARAARHRAPGDRRGRRRARRHARDPGPAAAGLVRAGVRLGHGAVLRRRDGARAHARGGSRLSGAARRRARDGGVQHHAGDPAARGAAARDAGPRHGRRHGGDRLGAARLPARRDAGRPARRRAGNHGAGRGRAAGDGGGPVALAGDGAAGPGSESGTAPMPERYCGKRWPNGEVAPWRVRRTRRRGWSSGRSPPAGSGTSACSSAMREVPREAFVPENLREFAYEDTPAADRARGRRSRSPTSWR